MMYPPTVIAVDDKVDELRAIVDALRSLDVACLPVLATGTTIDLQKPLSGIRLVFFDINYLPGVTSTTAMFETAATILLKVLAHDNGPYILITWTSKSDQHAALMSHFADIKELPSPAVSASLAKEKFVLAGQQAGAGVSGGRTLKSEIQAELAKHPQVAALMNWEMSARQAAGAVVGSMLELYSREDRFSGRCGPQLEQLLGHMASSAVGKGNVAADRRAALNEALAPILFDRLMHQPPEPGMADLWARAMGAGDSPGPTNPEHSPLLNALNHIALPASGPMSAGDRGVVFELTGGVGQLIADRCGISMSELAGNYLEMLKEKVKGQKDPVPAPPGKEEFDAGDCRWVLIGTRPICDQAQGRGTIRPLVLALEVPGAMLVGKKVGLRIKPHDALKLTPEFALMAADGSRKMRRLVINWHWPLSMSELETRESNIHYRLRESLINELTAVMSGYIARPGITTF